MKSWQKYFLFAGAILSFVAIGGQRKFNERAKEHEAIFGTRESPSFQVKKCPYKACPTFRELASILNERNKDLEKYNAESKIIYQELKILEKEVKENLPQSERERILSVVIEKGKKAREIYGKVNERISAEIYSEMSPLFEELSDDRGLAEDQKEFGGIEEKVNALFLEATEKKVPNNIEMTLIPHDDDNIAGWHNLTKNSVFVEERAYPSTLNTYMHELGHVIVQHAEEKYFDRFWFIPKKADFEVVVLEEANAYAFTNASIGFIKEDKLRRKAVESQVANMVSQILFYKEGNITEHSKGMALCDAANEYFKDPAEAFNYLSRTSENNIKKEIWDLAEGLKEVDLPEDRAHDTFLPVYLSIKLRKKLKNN